MVDGHPGVRVSGPLAPYAVGFSAALTGRGYARGSVSTQVNLMAHLSRWLSRRGLDAAVLTAPVIERFVAVMRATRKVLVAERGLAPLLGYLREVGATPPVTDVQDTALAELLRVFGRYLTGERGLADSTVRRHLRVASEFLAELGDPLADALHDLSGGQVLAMVSRRIAPPVGVPSAQAVAGSTRILLGFLFVTGRISRELAPVVPSVARWPATALPGRMQAAEVAAVLDSCDRGTQTGRRDYAVCLLVARLGLRAGDVAALTLDDLDWRAGEITVHGKAGRVDKLPLPHEVGAAIASYLSARQPGDTCRALFISALAPLRSLSLTGVGLLVQTACTRAGVAAGGPRLLRQTLASDLLAAGAPLAEIAQVLRHRDIATTARHYAKVAPQALAELVRPWPVQTPGAR